MLCSWLSRALLQVATGLCTYFDKALHVRLLYNAELHDAEEVGPSALRNALDDQACAWLAFVLNVRCIQTSIMPGSAVCCSAALSANELLDPSPWRVLWCRSR